MTSGDYSNVEQSEMIEETDSGIIMDEFHPRAAMINILNTILGAGILAMPFAIKFVGLIPGLLLILLSGTAAAFGLHLLAYCAVPCGRHASFNNISKLTYPKAALLFDAAIAIKCFGVAVSYLVIIGDLMPEAAIRMWNLESDSIFTLRQTWISLAMIIIIPFSFMKRLDSLKYTSIVALFALLYLFILVIFYFFKPDGHQAPDGSVHMFDFDVTFLKKLPIYVFAFTCHQNIFAVHNELNKQSMGRMNFVIFSSVGISAVTYLIVGTCGYLMFGTESDSNLLKNLDDSILVTIGRVAVSILVMLSYPLQCHPSRASFEKVFTRIGSCMKAHKRRAAFYAPVDGRADEDDDSHAPVQMSNFNFISLTTGILLASFAIAYFVSDLGSVLSLVGATGSTTICYILPALFFLKMTRSQPWTIKRLSAAVLLASGLIIMPLCVAFVFIDTEK